MLNQKTRPSRFADKMPPLICMIFGILQQCCIVNISVTFVLTNYTKQSVLHIYSMYSPFRCSPIQVLIESLETRPEVCSTQTTVIKIMSQENGRHLKDGLLLGDAIRYVSLFCLPCHNYIRATALCKQVPACVRNIV